MWPHIDDLPLPELVSIGLWYMGHIDDLMQDCSNSIANALELLQPYT